MPPHRPLSAGRSRVFPTSANHNWPKSETSDLVAGRGEVAQLRQFFWNLLLGISDMIEDVRGLIDYDVCGAGPTIVLVPGSCSTGAAWRPVIAAWDNQFRCVTTSLLGYGGTVERRTARDPSISHEADALESVIRTA